jgi:predicted transcriptional regulator
MATLVELATEMVIARAKSTPLTADEMMTELNRFHAALKKLESGEVAEEVTEAATPATTMTLKEAFKKNEIACMICGKGGFKTLTRHLATSHGVKPRAYRQQFGISPKQSLSSKAYSETRRQMANDRGLADNLKKAREVRMANVEEAKTQPAAKVKVTEAKAKVPGKVVAPKAKAPKAKTPKAKTPKKA